MNGWKAASPGALHGYPHGGGGHAEKRRRAVVPGPVNSGKTA